jgi:hypothetical protein
VNLKNNLIVDKQVKLLNDIIKMPLKLRNLIRFLNSNLTNLSIKFLMTYILSFKKDMPSRVYSFKFPNSNTNYSKYSLLFLIKFLIYFYLIIYPEMTQKPN